MSLARAVCANKKQAKLIACRNTNAGHGTDTPKMYIQKLSKEKDIFCPIETTNYSWWFQRFCWAAKFDPKFDGSAYIDGWCIRFHGFVETCRLVKG